MICPWVGEGVSPQARARSSVGMLVPERLASVCAFCARSGACEYMLRHTHKGTIPCSAWTKYGKILHARACLLLAGLSLV